MGTVPKLCGSTRLRIVSPVHDNAFSATAMTSLRFPLFLTTIAIILASIIGLPALSSASGATGLTSTSTVVPHVPIHEAQVLSLPSVADKESPASDSAWASGIVPQLRDMLRDADADVQRSALQLIVGLRKQYGDALDLSALAADIEAAAANKAMITRADRRLVAAARRAVRG